MTEDERADCEVVRRVFGPYGTLLLGSYDLRYVADAARDIEKWTERTDESER